MGKMTLNAVVDIIMILAFIPTLISGVVLYGILPEGGRFSGFAVFMGFTRRAWENMHNWTGFVLAALIILYLILHWKFFRTVPACFRKGRKEGSRN